MLNQRLFRFATLVAVGFAGGYACSSGKEGPSSGAASETASTAMPTGAGGGNSNSATTAASPNVAPPVKAVPFPNVPFVNNPGGNGPKVVALTFDDGPDQGSQNATGQVLDFLKANNLKATFFLCSNLWTMLVNDPIAQNNVKRMIPEGHDVGNHTVDHPTLNTNILSQIPGEFNNNIVTYKQLNIFGPTWNGFTMYRAPYGTPFQDGNIADVQAIAPLTATQGVHVGWGIDTHDWECAQSVNGFTPTVDCVVSNLNKFLTKNASGPILMHAVYQNTVNALPSVLAALNTNGYQIVQAEDIIKAKYGATSAQLAQAQVAANFDDATLSAAAVASLQQSKWYLGTEEN